MVDKASAFRAVSQQFKDRTNAVIEGVMAHLRDDNAKEILGPGLSPLIGRGSLKSIVTFALYADVLRMVRDMVMADGEISDEEVQESLGLLSVLAGGFAKVRKEYAAFTQLTPENARDFLSQYTSDSGLFGYANASTKWAGVNACRNIEATCGDFGPLNSFGGALVSWAESVASSDGMSPTEQRHLAAIRSLCTSAKPSPSLATEVSEEEAGETLLTNDVARQYASDPDETDLSSFTDLQDDAAATLAKLPRDLYLTGIKSFSAKAAAYLSRHLGELHLDSVTDLSVESLLALSQHLGAIHLSGLTNVSKEHAMVLAEFLSGVELPIDDYEPDVRRILSKHPSSRVRDGSELTEWLLEKLQFDESVDHGRDWVSEEVMGSLLDICTCWQSADDANGVPMTGSPLEEIVKAIKAAGSREIHVVQLYDKDQTVLMFVGTSEEIRKRLLSVVSTDGRKSLVDDEDDSEGNESETDLGDHDEDDEKGGEKSLGGVATVQVVRDFLKHFDSGDWDFLSSCDSLDLEAAALLAADFPWGDGNELWLGGLRALPAEVASALSTPLPQDEQDDNVPILVLSGLEELHENTAKALSKRKWFLQLPKLKTLDSGAAAYLGKIPRLLIGVEDLSGPVATKLATASLLFVVVPRLSVDAAVGLSAAAGELIVDVKQKLSDEALAALQDCRGTLSMQGEGAPS